MPFRVRPALLLVHAAVDLMAGALLVVWPHIVYFAPYVGVALLALGMLAMGGFLSTHGNPTGRTSRVAWAGIPVLHTVVGAFLAFLGLDSGLLVCATPVSGSPGGGCAEYWYPFWEIAAPGLALTGVGLVSMLGGRRA